MKRWLVRLSIVSVVVALGLIAIAQARHGLDDTEEIPAAAHDEGLAEVPGPIRLQAGDANPLRNREEFTEPGLPSRMGHLPKSRALPSDGDEIPSADVVLQRSARRNVTKPAANGNNNHNASPSSPQTQTITPPSATAGSNANNVDRYSPPAGAARSQLAAHNEAVAGQRYQVAGDESRYTAADADDAPSEPTALREPARLAAAPQAKAAAVDQEPKPLAAARETAKERNPPAGAATSREANPLRESGMPRETVALPAAPRSEPSQTDQDDHLPSAPAVSAKPQSRLISAAKKPTTSVLAPAATSSAVKSSPSTARSQASAPLSHASAPARKPASESQQPITGEGAARPGARSLEGTQAPSLTLIKTAPDEIQVGKQCTFEIVVRNVGSVAADNVEIHDAVPQGTQLVSTAPRADVDAQGGEIVWRLGRMEPGSEEKLSIELMPVGEGEIGSVATVHFQAQAAARTLCTKPELALELTAAPQVMIGEDIRLSIKLSNPGSGAATGVVLLETIPAGMKHPAGASLEFEIGRLSPGESRELELVLTADQAGAITNTLVAQGDANLETQAQVDFEVIAPALSVDVKGPKKRYLERPATYNISISNPGTAAAQEIELTTYLPPGMKFVKANNAGTYDPQTHSVSWGLEELPAQQSGSVELVAVPIEAGEQKFRVEGKASRGLVDEAMQSVEVEGLAAVLFTVADVADPIEINGETAYEVQVINQGSKDSTNVQVVVLLPPDIKAISATGPTRYTIEEGRVVFSPLQRLAPKADTTYQIKVQALRKGDQRVRVQLQTDEMQSPVTKEESTQVYADE